MALKLRLVENENCVRDDWKKLKLEIMTLKKLGGRSSSQTLTLKGEGLNQFS
jgi:hypothetical protein